MQRVNIGKWHNIVSTQSAILDVGACGGVDQLHMIAEHVPFFFCGYFIVGIVKLNEILNSKKTRILIRIQHV